MTNISNNENDLNYLTDSALKALHIYCEGDID